MACEILAVIKPEKTASDAANGTAPPEMALMKDFMALLSGTNIVNRNVESVMVAGVADKIPDLMINL